MKIRIYLILIVLILAAYLPSCQNETKAEVDTVSKSVANRIVVKAVRNDPRTNDFPTKLKEFSIDIDSDNVEEQIELYTAAGREDNGDMLWDDGQQWLLVVVDKDKYYPLYSDFLQLGEIYFNVSKIGDEMQPQVNVMLSTQCGIEMIDYVFNSKKGYFEGKVAYRDMDKFLIYSSIPSY